MEEENVSQNIGVTADGQEGGGTPGAMESQGAGLGSETDNIPPSPADVASEPVVKEGGAMADAEPAGEAKIPASEPVAREPEQAVRQNPLKMVLDKCRQVIAGRKQKKLEKIVEFAREQKTKGKQIKNDDVQKLLRVSPATANRYLDELVRAGKLKKTGNVGQAVFYEVID